MSSPLQLTTAQACAVYGAMCALNNVGGVVDVRLDTIGGLFGFGRVWENEDGSVVVMGLIAERYDSQDAFAKAYSIVN